MTRIERLKNVVEIVAIVCAGGWAAYTFIYHEYFMATRFLIIGVEMSREAGLSNGLVPVQIRVKAKNPSSRRVFVESAYFEVHADKVEPASGSAFTPAAYESALNDPALIAKGFKRSSTQLVGGGGLLQGAWIDPGEELAADRLLYVPSSQFDDLETNVYVLSALHDDDVDVQQSVDSGFSVNWVVRVHGDREWMPWTDPRGKRLLNKYTAFATGNANLVLSKDGA